VKLEIEVNLPKSATGQIVRVIAENSWTLKFESHRFEKE